jgi:hypothetical protein
VQLYYGVTLLISSMDGNPYLNQFLGFVFEAPAILATAFAIERLGRRSTAAALLLQGTLCSRVQLPVMATPGFHAL